MRAVKVLVRGDFGISAALTEEEELPFSRGDGLAPHVEGESTRCAAEESDKVVFPKLDGLLGDVAGMVVGWNELVGHAGADDSGLVLGGRFVIQNLVFGVEAGRAYEGDDACLFDNHGIFDLA